MRGKCFIALVLAILLSGCATRHEAIPASGITDNSFQPDSVLIIGRLLVKDNGGIAPHTSWIKPSLHFAHAPSGADLAAQSRLREGIVNYPGDFITSVSTDSEGYFYYFVPPGRYKVNYVSPHGRPLLGFDVLQAGKSYYLGTLIFDSGASANTLNMLTFPEIVDQSEQVASDLHDKLSNTLLKDVKKSKLYPLPCSFASIGFPPREDHWSSPKNAAVGRGPVAITVSQFAPRNKIDPLLEGKSTAAGKMAGGGFIEGAAAGAIAPLENPITLVLYPFVAPITITVGAVIGGTAGGIMGAAMGLNDDDVHKFNIAVSNTFGGKSLQERLAERIQIATQPVRTDVVVRSDMGPKSKGEEVEYMQIKNEGYREYIELTLIKAGLNISKSNPTRLTLLLSIRAKFRSLEQRGSPQTRYLEFTSKQISFDDLVANKGEQLTRTLNDSLDLVGHCMAEALFLEVPAAVSR